MAMVMKDSSIISGRVADLFRRKFTRTILLVSLALVVAFPL
jgi:hypothetical protein